MLPTAPSPKPSPPRASRRRALVTEAHRVADAGDRWLVTAARRVRRIGGWARRELSVIGESARAAWRTTLGVARHVTPARLLPPRATPREARRRGDALAHREARRGDAPAHRLGLLAATPADEVAPREDPRVPLLLRLLGELVSDYGVRHAEAMGEDERLWTLIDLLHRSRPRGRRRERGARRGEP